MERIPNITGLRFFLAVFVMIFHISEFCSKHNIPFYNSLPVFHKGYEAVCVFFSLSGFLIIRQLYLEKEKMNTISLKNFYFRRALRIFPLYFLILIFGLTYYNYILPKFGFTSGFYTNYNLYEGLLLSIFFMPNVFACLYNPGGIIEILWSIGVEEQFYLFIAPVLLFLPVRKIIFFLLVSTIVFFTIYFTIEGNILYKYTMLFFYFTSSGIISILLLKKPQLFNNKLVIYISLLSFILYFTTNCFVNLFSLSNYNLFSMLLFCLVIGVLSNNPYFILNHRVTTYLGKISYGIYVYHAIVIQFIGLIYIKLFSNLGLNNYVIIVVYNCIVLITTIFISHFSYQYFEKFFMNFYRNKSVSRKNFL
jgi:peptidoglycan/LPS O-acetylase OafA/YrhL